MQREPSNALCSCGCPPYDYVVAVDTPNPPKRKRLASRRSSVIMSSPVFILSAHSAARLHRTGRDAPLHGLGMTAPIMMPLAVQTNMGRQILP